MNFKFVSPDSAKILTMLEIEERFPHSENFPAPLAIRIYSDTVEYLWVKKFSIYITKLLEKSCGLSCIHAFPGKIVLGHYKTKKYFR